jgi:hypothetical protein
MRTARIVAPVALGLLALASTALGGCASEASDDATSDGAFSSNQATLLDFEFDAELVTDFSWNDKQTIQDQLLYTIGHLNGNKSVGRLDDLTLTNIKKEDAGGGKSKISYHAKLPVAWGSKVNLPESYELKLPKDVSGEGQSAFTEKHKHECVDWGAHDVDTGSMWYYYRPNKSGCNITDEEIVKTTAKVTKSTLNTEGKYPEYHKVWEDDRLEVVAIFGKYEDGATTGDPGITGYNSFVSSMRTKLGALGEVKTTPADVPASPGTAMPDVSFEAKLADGKTVKITALLVDNVRTAGAAFDRRYEELSTHADLITYNGHAGLGQNVRALAQKGKFIAGKYQIFFMNGCDTFAYVDGSLAQTRARLNPDDPTGTKYMEFVTNAMPSYFSSMPAASTAMTAGLLDFQNPKTYDKIFEGIDRAEVVLVTGEEDNVFTPGMPIGSGGGGGGGGVEFKPFEESGTVTKSQEKAFAYDVPAGSYVIDLSGDADADLYVRKGAAAEQRKYDCRPYKSGSVEQCKVTFTEPGKLHVMVRGWAASSNFKVKGARQ